MFEDRFLELFRLKRKKNSTLHFSPDIIFVIKSGMDDIMEYATHRGRVLVKPQGKRHGIDLK